MSSFNPLIQPTDLGIYLDDKTINAPRAQLMIELAQNACQGVVDPIPDSALYVLYRVAARGYGGPSARQYQLDQADNGYAQQPGPVGGVYLTSKDVADLLASVDSAPVDSAFTIKTPAPQHCAPFDPYRQVGVFFGGICR